MITDPPLLLGVSKVIVACQFPLVATMLVGVSGVVIGVTETLLGETTLVPTSFTADILKV